MTPTMQAPAGLGADPISEGSQRAPRVYKGERREAAIPGTTEPHPSGRSFTLAKRAALHVFQLSAIGEITYTAAPTASRKRSCGAQIRATSL